MTHDYNDDDNDDDDKNNEIIQMHLSQLRNGKSAILYTNFSMSQASYFITLSTIKKSFNYINTNDLPHFPFSKHNKHILPPWIMESPLKGSRADGNARDLTGHPSFFER